MGVEADPQVGLTPPSATRSGTTSRRRRRRPLGAGARDPRGGAFIFLAGYRGEDLAAVTKAASSASRLSRLSAWMENIHGLSTRPHSVPYTGNRSADPAVSRNVSLRIQNRSPSRPAS